MAYGLGHGVKRPRAGPGEAHEDPAYDMREIRSYLRRRSIKANIAVNPRSRLKPRHGRPYRLDEEAYKRMRSCVERFFARLTGGFRRLTQRWERLASIFLSLIQLASIIIYWRDLKRVHPLRLPSPIGPSGVHSSTSEGSFLVPIFNHRCFYET